MNPLLILVGLGGLVLLVSRKSGDGTIEPVAVLPEHVPQDAPVVRRTAVQLRSPRRSTSNVREVLRATNDVRARGACGYAPAGPLTWNDELARAAEAHARDMAEQDYFSHPSLDGRTPSQRMRAAGFGGATVGENIAAGQATAGEVLVGWEQSPGHCKNLMNPNYRVLGVGYAFKADSQYQHYWVQNFGG